MIRYDDLREFLEVLRKNGNIVEINDPVAVNQEMTEIHRRLLLKDKNDTAPVIIFNKPVLSDGRISEIPVIVNLFGTKSRVALAMNKKLGELREFGELLAYLRQPTPPKNFKDIIDKLPLLKLLYAMKPKIVKKVPVQQLIFKGDEVDLFKLPIQTCFPDEPAPLITWGVTVTQGINPKEDPCDNYNLGIYRMQVLTKNKLIMRWLAHRGGAAHFAKWKEANPEKPMPVSVIIGADPATILAGVIPIPDTVSEYEFAGLLKGSKIELAKSVTNNILIPAKAEIIIEGYIETNEVADEGPYGDHTGYYNEVAKFPVLTISAITMRKDPFYLSTFTARPPDEPSILAETMNDIFVPLLKQQFPEIKDFYLPPAACSYRMAIISMKKLYPGHAKRVMMATWSFLRQFLYTKMLIIIDDDLDARNWDDIIWAISTNVDAKRDTTIIENTPIDYLDFASPVAGLGSKIAIDATTKIGVETNRQWGRKIKPDPEIIKKVDENWQKWFKN